MAVQPAISVSGVSKSFKLPHEKPSGLKQAIIKFKPGKKYEVQQVLENVSFEIKSGEFFGIVGRNGSGKSTLLKLLAHIYTPNKGTINVNGSLTPFIELGVGFNMELTGRENVFLNGALLGFDHKQVDAIYDEIVEFAELERFMDQKLKNYSSGMQVRLAFSIAIRARSDILLLDEVLAVGDAIFQEKCFNYFKELKKDKKTVVLVSHDSRALQEFCDRGILVEKGKIISEGTITKVLNDYTEILNEKEEKDEIKVRDERKTKDRWGTGDILVKDATTQPVGSNKQQTVFTDKDKEFIVEVKLEAKSEHVAPVYGITISDASGERIFVSNTLWLKVPTDNVVAGDVVVVRWVIPNIFNTGDFFVSPAVASENGYTSFDWRENYLKFKVRKTAISSGIVNTEHTISVRKGTNG
jgi:ABC-2 type transport system ATP-binding protein